MNTKTVQKAKLTQFQVTLTDHTTMNVKADSYFREGPELRFYIGQNIVAIVRNWLACIEKEDVVA